MKNELITDLRLPKIGLGTSRIGGRVIPNRMRETDWLGVLRHALEIGYTHIDTAEFYALGYSEELIGRAIVESGIGREAIFVTTKVWPIHLSYKSMIRACEKSLHRLDTDYIDLYLIHIPNPFVPLSDTFRALNQLIQQGKIRNLGVSNFNVGLLARSKELSNTPIITNQIPYNIFNRSYVRNGVLEYCRENSILITAYSPLRNRNIPANSIIRSIAKAHQSTPQQIALAWLIHQPNVISIPMSFNRRHLKENLESVDIELNQGEIHQLTKLER